MARHGPPRTPNEVLRKRGGFGAHDRLRSVPAAGTATPVPLPRAKRAPRPPRPLGAEGTVVWKRIWTSGLDWISPTSDMELVLMVCEVTDEIARLQLDREGLIVPGMLSQGEKRALDAARDLRNQRAGWLALLGFSPSDRARLSVGEVIPEDPLREFRGS